MPFEFSDRSLPSGTPYLHVEVSELVELADGEGLYAQLQRPEHRRGKVLCVVAKGTVYSPEVRKYFPNITDQFGACAAVVTSPIVRAAINLMIRLTPQGAKFSMFKDEASAIEWLEAQPVPADR